MQFISRDPQIILLHDFFSPKEIQHIIDFSANKFTRSPTVDGIHHGRTSTTLFLQKAQDPIIANIEHRVAVLCNVSHDQIEPLQVVRYEKGQQYRPHYDYFVNPNRDVKQRRTTIFVYLTSKNDGCTSNIIMDGTNFDHPLVSGYTVFPIIGKNIKPVAGMAVMWENVNPYTNQVDQRTLHGGSAIQEHDFVKLAVNIWIREK